MKVHKAVKFSDKAGVVDASEFSRHHGLMDCPSYDSEQEIHTDHHPEQPEASSAQAWMRTTDDDPWARKTILCLDGGGVRGLSSLYILGELMKEIAKIELRLEGSATTSTYTPLVYIQEEKLASIVDDTAPSARYLPCHYFDFIAGTSTGSPIAIMLGRLQMDVDTCIKEYEQLAARVFKKPSPPLVRFLPQYNRAARGEMLKVQINSLRPPRLSSPERSDQLVLFKSDPFQCRTIVCSFRSTENRYVQKPFLFRSYDRPAPTDSSTTQLERDLLEASAFAIWQVARASSAAPFYHLKPTSSFDRRYYDAAVDLNNPSKVVVNEVSLLAGRSNRVVDVLLSVGGGNTKENKPKSRFGGRDMEQELIDRSDAVHNRIRSESKDHFRYFRLDVQSGLHDVRLDEWKPKSNGTTTLRKIRDATTQYLQQPEIISRYQMCAQALVRKRKERARTLRWECFATGTRYKCPKEACPKSHLIFEDRNDLFDHLRIQHRCPPLDTVHHLGVKTLLNKGRTRSE